MRLRNKGKVNPSSYENYFFKIKIRNNSNSSYLKDLYSLAYLRIFKASLSLEGKMMVHKSGHVILVRNDVEFGGDYSKNILMLPERHFQTS